MSTETTPKLEPYDESMEGWVADPDNLNEYWPNTVAVRAVEAYDPARVNDAAYAYNEERPDYADTGEVRQMVEIDTNYKATRVGEHPVRLTREDALQLAVHVLKAAEDTFHYSRCGQLRAAEASGVLQELANVAHAVEELREHALSDLLTDVGVE